MFIQRILRKGLAVVAALLLQASMSIAQGAENNTDRAGSDYQAPIELEFKQGSFLTFESECEGLCKKDGICRAWTLVKAGVQGPKARCYLKDRIPAAKKNNCCVSGTIGDLTGLEPGINRPGSDYRSFGVGNADLRDQPELNCKAACEEEAQCRAWSYVWHDRLNRTGKCFLKNSVPAKSKDSCCISGTVSRADPQEVADRNPAGKSFEQCEAAFQRNTARCQQRFGGAFAAKVACDAEMQQLRAACLGLAAQANAGGGTTGGGGGGVPAEWAETLRLHNAKRAIHRSPALSWSANLAAQAQAWANRCSFSHDSFNGFGENLYWGTNATGKDAVEWWYAEVKFYDWNNPIGSFNQGDNDRSRETRHFTQVVWKATTTLGCGMAACDGKNYFVCRYQPPGNFNANNPGVLDANVQAIQGVAATRSKTQQPEPDGGAQAIATVIQSVDVYDSPGGNGNQTGSLKKGAKVKVVGCSDGWCEVQGKRVPGGSGYVYSADDFRSLRF